MLIVLATVPLSLTGALAALMVLSASSAYGSVLLAHIRSHFPDHLAGRGATTGNMAQLVGAALLPMLTGLIPPLFPMTGLGLFAARLSMDLRHAGRRAGDRAGGLPHRPRTPSPTPASPAIRRTPTDSRIGQAA